MNEDSILKKIRQWCEPTSLNSTILGVGDDAAVLASSGRPLVLASDLSIENVHFDFKFSKAQDVGYKSIARVLSDVAAMGASPLAVTISIAIPKTWGDPQTCEFLESYFQGAVALALEAKCSLAGGDLSRADTPLVIDVAAVGELRPESPAWLRSGARAGDHLFVSGELGGAAFALEQFRLGRAQRLTAAQAEKHLRPRPRFDVAETLSPTHLNDVKAAMDISDGLVRDVYRLCVASGVSVVLNETELRLANGASIKQALVGGDDYELLFALAPEAGKSVRERLARVGSYKLGTFSAQRTIDESEVFLEHANGTKTLLASTTRSPGGHDPFRDM